MSVDINPVFLLLCRDTLSMCFRHQTSRPLTTLIDVHLLARLHSSEELDEPAYSRGSRGGSSVAFSADLLSVVVDARLDQAGERSEALRLVVEAGQNEVLDAGGIGRVVAVHGEIVEVAVQREAVTESDRRSQTRVPLLLQGASSGVGLIGPQSFLERHVAIVGPGAVSTDASPGAVRDEAWTISGW